MLIPLKKKPVGKRKILKIEFFLPKVGVVRRKQGKSWLEDPGRGWSSDWWGGQKKMKSLAAWGSWVQKEVVGGCSEARLRQRSAMLTPCFAGSGPESLTALAFPWYIFLSFAFLKEEGQIGSPEVHRPCECHKKYWIIYPTLNEPI